MQLTTLISVSEKWLRPVLRDWFQTIVLTEDPFWSPSSDHSSGMVMKEVSSDNVIIWFADAENDPRRSRSGLDKMIALTCS